ncbi:MAG: hypothetical protein JW751_11940 [Polyangiaceae bacterium]|nr:hypothetical protein [Polyangiaceae bacterium]
MFLLDANERVLDPSTRGLGIGLFDGAFERQFNPGAPAFDLGDPILNEAAEDRNFVGSDSRRFRVHLSDPSPVDPGSLPDGRRFVMARWTTRDGSGQILDDNRGASEITLVEGEPGTFRSMSLMLVTSEQDRDLETHCGIEGRYSYGHERRSHGSSDHRLRLASVFGSTVLSYPASAANPTQTLTAQPFLPQERRRLAVSLFVGSRTGLDRPAATPSEVFEVSLARAIRIYAALGIDVQTAEHPAAEAARGQRRPRVCRVQGGHPRRDFYYVIDAPAWLGRRVDLSTLSSAAFTAFCQGFPDVGAGVRVLYVDGFPDGKFGMACPPCDFVGCVEAGACACQAERYPARALMAHEVGHILTDKSSRYGRIADQTNGFPQSGGHYSRPAHPPDNRHIHFYNLMGGSRYRLYDVDVREAPPDAAARIFNQYRDIRASPYVTAVAP